MKLIKFIKSILTQDQNQESNTEIFQQSWSSNLLLTIGTINIFFIFILFTISSLGFLFGISLTQLHVPLALGTTILFIYLTAKLFFNHHIPHFLIMLIFFTSAIMFSTNFAAQFYDLSYDGQWYHQDIIIALKEGWNPIYTQIDQSQNPIANLLNAYPKTAELNQAAWYKFTDKIEISKMFNLFMMITAFLFSFALLLKIRILNPFVSLTTALLINLNPVALCQLASFYIDGQAYALIISFLSILGVIYFSNRKYLFIPLICLIVLIVNIKLPAILFSLLFLGFFLAYCWNSNKIKKMLTVTVVALITYALATILVGFNPYVTNTLRYHNPLFPHIGGNSTDYVKVNAPENFYDKDPLSLLIYSTFSKSAFTKGDGKRAELKIPFTFSNQELATFSSTDPVESGFGPLFGGIILISLMIFIIGIKVGHQSDIRLLYLIAGLIFLSTVSVSASFYARFVPQFWLIPPLAFLMAFIINSKLTNILAYLLFGLLVMNITMVEYVNLKSNYERSQQMKHELSLIKKQSLSQKQLINFGDFRSNRVRFTEADINFDSTTEPLNCGPKTRLLEQLVDESDIYACNLQSNP